MSAWFWYQLNKANQFRWNVYCNSLYEITKYCKFLFHSSTSVKEGVIYRKSNCTSTYNTIVIQFKIRKRSIQLKFWSKFKYCVFFIIVVVVVCMLLRLNLEFLLLLIKHNAQCIKHFTLQLHIPHQIAELISAAACIQIHYSAYFPLVIIFHHWHGHLHGHLMQRCDCYSKIIDYYMNNCYKKIILWTHSLIM